jgi:hypothetical protein
VVERRPERGVGSETEHEQVARSAPRQRARSRGDLRLRLADAGSLARRRRVVDQRRRDGRWHHVLRALATKLLRVVVDVHRRGRGGARRRAACWCPGGGVEGAKGDEQEEGGARGGGEEEDAARGDVLLDPRLRGDEVVLQLGLARVQHAARHRAYSVAEDEPKRSGGKQRKNSGETVVNSVEQYTTVL